MPQKMRMFISNNNYVPMNLNNPLNSSSSQLPAPSALSAPMIKRIHNVRPGCGSCGKK